MIYAKSYLFEKQAAYAGLDKTATVTLSRDSNSWEQDISQALHREHPFIQNYNIAIYLTKVNGEVGAGIGSIAIDDKVLIPIVIDKFKMAPLDLFQFDGKLYPLTRTSLESTLQNTKLGTPVEPGKGELTDQTLYSRTQPPSDGKYAYAGILSKVASLEAMNKAVSEAFPNSGEFKVALVKNASIHEVLKGMIESQPGLASGQEKSDKKTGHLKVRKSKDFKKTAKAGVFEVPTQFGSIPAIVADFVFDEHGRIKEDRGMVIGLDDDASYAPFFKNAGLTTNACDPETEIPEEEPCSGDRGIFYKIAGAHVLCSEPIQIKYATNSGWGGATSLNQNLSIFKSASCQTPIGDGRSLVMPLDWHWLKVARQVKPLDMSTAEAVQAQEGEYVQVLHNTGRVVVRGIEGFPGDGDSIEKAASQLMEHFPQNEVIAVLKTAREIGSVHLSAIWDTPSVTKTASIATQPMNLLREATYIHPCKSYSYPAGNGEVIKVAAVTDDQSKTTIDAVLGLNFLTPENLHKFVDKIEQISEAKDVVSKLLLASRLGLEVDSRPLRTAMYALDSVERDLRELQNAVETQERTG